jgi:hypothetical protein
MLWIILSVTRRKSPVARWIFSAVYAIGFVLTAYLAMAGMFQLSDIEWIGWTLFALAIVQLALIWPTATSKWLAKR